MSSVFVVPMFLILAACGPADVACTEEARASVVVHVFGLAMDPNAPYALDDATVSYSTGGGGVPLACENAGGGDYTCGYEQEGHFDVIVEHPDHGPGNAAVDVHMTEDGCHVETVEVDVTIDCLAC